MTPAAEDLLLSRNKLTITLAATAMTLAAYGAVAGIMPWFLQPGLALPIDLAMSVFVLSQRRYFGGATAAIAGWFLISAAAMIVYATTHAGQPLFWRQAAVLGACLALSRLLAARTAAHWGTPARATVSVLATAAAMLVGGGLGLNVLEMATAHLPLVCDAILYRMDGTLGLNGLSRWAGDVLSQNHALRKIALAIYEYNLLFALPAMLSEALFTRKATAELGFQLFASAMLAFPFYCVTAGMGPLFFFGASFPDHMPAFQTIAAHFAATPAAAPRNAMPSVHFAWALLFWLAVRESPPWQRGLAGGFILFTVIATLGFGEHYAVDLIAACPFTLFIRGLCCAGLPPTAPPRAWAIGAGAVILLLWLAAIRLAPASLMPPAAMPSLALISLLSLAILEPRLHRAERLLRSS